MLRKILVYSVIWFLSGLLLISCERGVRASREEGPETYQPRPAPTQEAATKRELKGELISIDVKNNTMMVRAENGMEQTFRFDEQTLVQGVSTPSRTTNQAKTSAVRSLIGKEGSEMTVAWEEEAGAKVATSVTVDQLVTKKVSRKNR